MEMPALHNHHCFTYSTATLVELCREDVPGSFSCSSECKHRKCRYTVLSVGCLDPLMSFIIHSLKSHIFSFPFDLVVILRKLIHKLFIKHLTISIAHIQCIIFFNNFCWQTYLSFSHQKSQDILDCLHCTLSIK